MRKAVGRPAGRRAPGDHLRPARLRRLQPAQHRIWLQHTGRRSSCPAQPTQPARGWCWPGSPWEPERSPATWPLTAQNGSGQPSWCRPSCSRPTTIPRVLTAAFRRHHDGYRRRPAGGDERPPGRLLQRRSPRRQPGQRPGVAEQLLRRHLRPQPTPPSAASRPAWKTSGEISQESASPS